MTGKHRHRTDDAETQQQTQQDTWQQTEPNAPARVPASTSDVPNAHDEANPHDLSDPHCLANPHDQAVPHDFAGPHDPTNSHSLANPQALADLPDVAFLELADGRLQGVIPSETTPERVYASSISTGDHGLSCRSNDDRPCGGLSGRSFCRHIEALLSQAVKEFGAFRVARYLGIETPEGQELRNALHPTSAPSHASEVFSSFMQHMAYLKVDDPAAR